MQAASRFSRGHSNRTVNGFRARNESTCVLSVAIPVAARTPGPQTSLTKAFGGKLCLA